MLRLETLRKETGLSQKEFAEKFNMTQQRISAYEKEKREPDIETLKQFAVFFNCSIDYLLGISDTFNSSNGISSKYNKLNETNKMIIENTIEGLLAKQSLDEKNK